MKINVAINGFGRIGRLFFRKAIENPNIDIVALNDLVPPDNLAYLLKYDTVHGRFLGQVEAHADSMTVNGRQIKIFSERDPAKLPWKDLNVDFVVESTGLFKTEDSAGLHLQAGAKRVIITAPASDAIPTFVMGVNHTQYDPKKDLIVSNASCTTNCLAPLIKVLLDRYGIH